MPQILSCSGFKIMLWFFNAFWDEEYRTSESSKVRCPKPKRAPAYLCNLPANPSSDGEVSEVWGLQNKLDQKFMLWPYVTMGCSVVTENDTKSPDLR